jgi:GNAT superfamily N-acetyltransferase
VAAVLNLARGTGIFKPLEIVALEEVLDEYLARLRRERHRAFVVYHGDSPAGFVYHAPAALTEATWYVYWIAVRRDLQGQGYGRLLLDFAQRDAAEHGAAQLIIETSSLPAYDKTRRFYLQQGYETAAVVRDFYAPGDDQVVFRKPLSPRE